MQKRLENLKTAKQHCKVVLESALICKSGSIDSRLKQAFHELERGLQIREFPENICKVYKELQEGIEWDLVASKQPSIRNRLSKKFLDLYDLLNDSYYQLLVARETETTKPFEQANSDQLITHAIQNQYQLQFYYTGQLRVGDPYIYGIDLLPGMRAKQN